MTIALFFCLSSDYSSLSQKSRQYPSSTPTPVRIPTWPRQYEGKTSIFPYKGTHMGGHAHDSMKEKHVNSHVKGPSAVSKVYRVTSAPSLNFFTSVPGRPGTPKIKKKHRKKFKKRRFQDRILLRFIKKSLRKPKKM